MKSRLALLSAAFRDAPLVIGPFTLRPLSAGSVAILLESGNAIFSDLPEADLTPAASMAAVFEFIFIHAAPLNEVIQVADDPAALRHAALRLGLELTMDDLDTFSAAWDSLKAQLDAAMIEIIPEKGGMPGKPVAGQPMPSPTGSPPSSMPLVAPPHPIESTGSSGNYPSPAPSNTSTPSTPPMAPESAGPPDLAPPPETILSYLEPLPS